METNLLVLGKGDSIITMILDNLYSTNRLPDIHIFNNLDLPILMTFHHDSFDIKLFNQLDIDNYKEITLGVYQPQHKISIIKNLNPDPERFINVIHNGLEMSQTSKLGKGVLINSRVSIAAHTTIGNFVSINRHVSIGHHTIIEDYCSINPGVNIAGNVTIGTGTLIGMGSNIINGVKIGKNTIIGAGSVVTRDIPDNVVAWGSPCKVIKDNI